MSAAHSLGKAAAAVPVILRIAIADDEADMRQFLREVRAELRKVAWPTRAEVINYSIIVFITLIVMTAAIAALDYAMSKLILWMYE